MVVLKTVDLSIFLLVVDNIRFNSLIKLLNWSLRFFSLKFLDFLMINVFITRGQWIVNTHWSRIIGNTYLLVSSLSVSSSSYLSLLKQEKKISKSQTTTNYTYSIDIKYKVYTHRSVNRCNQSINSYNIYVTLINNMRVFGILFTRLPIHSTYVVLIVSTTTDRLTRIS